MDSDKDYLKELKTSYVFLADGFETIEAMTPVDVLRRANMKVKTVSINPTLEVTSVQGVKVIADMLIGDVDVDDIEWIILPGGMPGAENLYNCEQLRKLIVEHYNSKVNRIAAICASPAVVLGQMGLLEGREATCYPGFQDLMKGAKYVGGRYTYDGTFVLGNGPAGALLWSLKIVRNSIGMRAAYDISNAMLTYPSEVESLFDTIET